MNFEAPHIDYAGISPIIALTVGLCVVLLGGTFRSLRRTPPALTLLTLAAPAGLVIWRWGEGTARVAHALRLALRELHRGERARRDGRRKGGGD